MPRWPGFIGGSNTLQSVIADGERTVNMYVEPTSAQAAQNAAALYSIPGYRTWSQSSTDVGGRALRAADGRLFGVLGAGFYEWGSTGVPTKHGSVAQDANPAQIVYNGKVAGQVGIASGGSVYTLDLATNTFAGPHFSGASITMLAYASGYGLGFDAATGRVYLSGLNDLTSWSLGTFFQRSKFPDPWRTMFVDANSLVWLIGDETFEVWYLGNPSSTQPFTPLSGLVGMFGIAAPFAYGVGGTGIRWLSRSEHGGPIIVETRGGVPRGVSSYAVNTALGGYRRSSTIANAECLIYEDDGHHFVNFTLPSASATWTYDATTQGWAERGVWLPNENRYDSWAPRVHADCFEKHLVATRNSSIIYEMTPDVATEIDGSGIRRLRRAPAISDERKRVPIDQLELIMDVGLGLSSGQGSDPQVMLRVSNDGRTWGNERRAGTGRLGEYRRRVTFNRLGAIEHGLIEVVFSDPSPYRVVDALVNNAEPG